MHGQPRCARHGRCEQRTVAGVDVMSAVLQGERDDVRVRDGPASTRVSSKPQARSHTHTLSIPLSHVSQKQINNIAYPINIAYYTTQ